MEEDETPAPLGFKVETADFPGDMDEDAPMGVKDETTDFPGDSNENMSDLDRLIKDSPTSPADNGNETAKDL